MTVQPEIFRLISMYVPKKLWKIMQVSESYPPPPPHSWMKHPSFTYNNSIDQHHYTWNILCPSGQVKWPARSDLQSLTDLEFNKLLQLSFLGLIPVFLVLFPGIQDLIPERLVIKDHSLLFRRLPLDLGFVFQTGLPVKVKGTEKRGRNQR